MSTGSFPVTHQPWAAWYIISFYINKWSSIIVVISIFFWQLLNIYDQLVITNLTYFSFYHNKSNMFIKILENNEKKSNQ